MNIEYIHPRNQYQLIIDKWNLLSDVSKETKSILRRGLWCCINPIETHGGILITGINPSYDKNALDEPNDCSFQDTVNSNGSNYWQTKHEMVKGLGVATAYIDLFPLRMTKQDSFMNDYVIPLRLKVELLQITQQCIESIHPRLIINPNMSSRVYWGLDEHYSWMGYDMEQVVNPTNKGQLYRIKGIKNKNDVLLPEFCSCLDGTYFLQYKYHGNGVLTRKQYITHEDINKLWSYINR